MTGIRTRIGLVGRATVAAAVFAVAAGVPAAGFAQAVPPRQAAVGVSPDAVVAGVAGQSITVANLRQLVAQAQADRGGDPNAALATMTPDGRAALLERAVDERLLAAAAKAEGFDARPDVRFLVEQAAARTLAAAYIESAVRELTPTPDAARAYLASHPEAFRVGARVRAHHLVVATAVEAEAARAAIAGGEPFERVASARSRDLTTKTKGGNLGWVAKGVMVKPFEEALFRLTPGELSAPVRTSFGFHVIRVDEIDPGSVPAFEAIEAEVTRAMVLSAFERKKADLAARYGVVVHRDVLAQAGR